RAVGRGRDELHPLAIAADHEPQEPVGPSKGLEGCLVEAPYVDSRRLRPVRPGLTRYRGEHDRPAIRGDPASARDAQIGGDLDGKAGDVSSGARCGLAENEIPECGRHEKSENARHQVSKVEAMVPGSRWRLRRAPRSDQRGLRCARTDVLEREPGLTDVAQTPPRIFHETALH